MPDNELFSGIPSLDDTQGLENYLTQAAVDDMGVGNATIPPALQQVQSPGNAQQSAQPAQATQTAQPAQSVAQIPNAPAAQPEAPRFTAEQVAQLIARNQQLETTARAQQSVPAAQSTTSPYTAQQAAVIKTLIDRGVSLDRIQAALNRGGETNDQRQQQLLQRVQQLENYIQQQNYNAEQSVFIDKMTAFGEKFGLSENDLVTFGNKAMSMGINLIDVNDVEAVFRAVYPDQYAIRSQRIAGAPAPQIYGGSNIPDAPRASANRMEDAYVDSFLKQAMPNQFSKH